MGCLINKRSEQNEAAYSPYKHDAYNTNDQC